MKKFLFVLLCIFLLLGTVGCVCSPEQPRPKSYEEQKALYDDIISQYTALLNAKHNGEELSAPNTENMDAREIAIAETLYGIVAACKNAKETEALGYGYKDLDDNGTPELILFSTYITVRAIFTISADAPILLEANYGADSLFLFTTQNRFILTRRNVTDHIEEIIYTCHVDGDKMVYDTVCGGSYDRETKELLELFRIVDGTRTPIDADTFRMLTQDYRKASRPGYSERYKIEAPRIHLPLAGAVTDPSLPIADFSDYAAIRKTALAISTCLREFKVSDWATGKYDNLFSFPSDRSFEYYARLLFSFYRGDRQIGYDEIDLNGDGLDELVLMNEDYCIKAIFTQKDGVPVLLDAFPHSYENYDTCWLDEEGLIHVDREGYYELEYNLYEFTKEGEYTLLYSILADNYGRYLTKDGKIEPITFEASMTLYYDGYVRYSEPFDPNEHTRNVSGLTYTPLAEATEDMIKLATDKTWHKYANLEKTTGNLAHSDTFITFRSATDAQMEMSIKYAFTFFYPDPDRDNYLLDDTTESTLSFTVRKEGDRFVFDENGMQGTVEFGRENLWILIEESTDDRFPVGNYCYKQHDSESITP